MEGSWNDMEGMGWVGRVLEGHRGMGWNACCSPISSSVCSPCTEPASGRCSWGGDGVRGQGSEVKIGGGPFKGAGRGRMGWKGPGRTWKAWRSGDAMGVRAL